MKDENVWTKYTPNQTMHQDGSMYIFQKSRIGGVGHFELTT
jgi:hypothetical protein